MDEAVRAFRHFLGRDLIYLIGGGSVIASFLLLFEHLSMQSLTTSQLLLLAGIAYVIGYAVQDLTSLTGLTSTANQFDLKDGMKDDYNRFTGRAWVDAGLDARQEFESFDSICQQSERFQARHERIVSARLLCTTMGPCLILSGAPLLLRAGFCTWHEAGAGSECGVLLLGWLTAFLLLLLGLCGLIMQRWAGWLALVASLLIVGTLFVVVLLGKLRDAPVACLVAVCQSTACLLPLAAGAVAVLIGVGLLRLAWVRGMQEIEFLARAGKSNQTGQSGPMSNESWEPRMRPR